MSALPEIDWTAVMLGIAAGVATALGPEWTEAVDRHDRNGYASIVRKDGAGFWLERERFGTGVFRIAVTGIYPKSSDGMKSFAPWVTRHYVAGQRMRVTTAPRITLSATRSHEGIARDIKRRFLPWYLEAFATSLDDCAAYEGGIVQAKRAAAQIGKAVRVMPRKSGRDETWAIHAEAGVIYVRESQKERPHISMRIDGIDVDKALAIARILGKRRRSR